MFHGRDSGSRLVFTQSVFTHRPRSCCLIQSEQSTFFHIFTASSTWSVANCMLWMFLNKGKTLDFYLFSKSKLMILFPLHYFALLCVLSHNITIYVTVSGCGEKLIKSKIKGMTPFYGTVHV